jgi:hypothetical protein
VVEMAKVGKLSLFSMSRKATSYWLLAFSLFLEKKLDFPLGKISKCVFENEFFCFWKTMLTASS